MFKKCTLNAGWTQYSFVISSCVIHPTSCLREWVMGERCLGVGCTFKSFCFKKMDLLFQFVLLPCSPFSKSNKWYKKIYWTIENWKETFRWVSPPKKDKFGGGETIKQGTIWEVKLIKKKCLLITARQWPIWILNAWDTVNTFPDETELVNTLWLRNKQYLHSCDIKNTDSLRFHPQT